ncbi:MAG: sigma-54-dependent transcriptional regulator, partial [Gammaproteobacteria bacterium]
NNYGVEEAGTVDEASYNRNLEDFDLIISDLRLPGAPGTAIIEKAGRTPVLIMTSYASVRSAVESMKMGAVDYIAKPFDHDEMLLTIKRILDKRRLEKENAAMKEQLDREFPVKGIVGSCPAMREVYSRIEKVAPTDTTVLITGESGTGKELVARALHEQSTRQKAPVIAVNCAAIPDNIIESELFGHEKGAFTGATEMRRGMVEVADGGTLFLDEIGELPLAAQGRLLRILQNGEIRRIGATETRQVDVRLVASTNRDLKQMVQDEEFRGDLYYRLRVMEIELPPLRERGSDVLELARHLLEKTCQHLNRSQMKLSRPALDAITAYDWPGNVRELENSIERAVILADSDQITPDLLAIEVGDSMNPRPMSGSILPDLSLEDYFKTFVTENQQHMTETELAKKLGISRKALWEKRQRLGIPRPKKSN